MAFAVSSGMGASFRKLSTVICLLSLQACGGGESKNSSSNQRIIQNPATGNSDNSASGIDETLNTRLMIGKSTSLPLDFPGGHICTDGTTPISWSLTGDASRVTLVDPTKCHPTLSTTDAFQGNDASISAVLTKADGKRIKWETPLVLKRPPIIDSQLIARNRGDWVAISRPQTNFYSFREIIVDGILHAQMVLAVKAGVGPDDGTAFFWPDNGSNRDRTINQGFEMGLQFRDQDGDDSSLVVSAGCEKADPTKRRFMTECPFAFDPVNLGDKLLKFRFKEDTAAAHLAEGPQLFRPKNVFGFASSQATPIDIFIEVRHPHTAEIARRVVGKILIFVYQYWP